MRKRQIIEFATEDNEGNETIHELPARCEVCPRCRGTGSHINPSIDGHGICEDEWERDWSREEREDYMSGVYDVTCYKCKGKRVVVVVDRDLCDQELLRAYDRDQTEERAYEHMCEMERKYGA
jgi:RecJ-like exonuclease